MKAELKPLWAAAVGAGALATGLVLPGTAGAYATAQCAGTTAAGVGASLQKDAQLGSDGLADSTGWAFDFSTLGNSVCPAPGPFDAKPTYAALGSGAGLTAMGSNGTTLDFTKDFGASDDPPTPAQLNNMNNNTALVGGPGSTFMHNIPVAQAAIAVAVHLPTGCTINAADFAPSGDRFAILNANLQKAFLGDGSVTWATLLPNSPSCAGPITRVVRYDQSGTSYQFTNYLAQIANSATWQAVANSPQQYQNWPNNTSANIVYGGTTRGPAGTCPLSGPNNTPPDPANGGQTQPANRSLCNGAGNLINAVIDTPGSIGYADMATQISKGLQYSSGASAFWIPVQHNGTGTKSATFADPALNSNGYQSGFPTGGANCAGSSYTPPSASDPTTVSWQTVFGENPTDSTYPICTLTYELIWDDAANAYGNTPAIDARQRSVKDYITYILANGHPNDGQNVLRALNYDPLPSNVLTVSRNGAASVHFP